MTVVPVEGSADVPRYVRGIIVLVACVLGFALGGSLRTSVLRLEGLGHAEDPLGALPAAAVETPRASASAAPSLLVVPAALAAPAALGASVAIGTAPAVPAAPAPPAAPPRTFVLPRDDVTPHRAPLRTPPAAAVVTGPHRTGAPLPARSGEGRRIVYQKSAMHLWVVDADGTVLRDYPVTGRPDRPKPGTYRVYSKSTASVSATQPRVTFRWMVRFAYGETARIGFHDIPRWASNGRPIQDVEDLGDPIGRGGCVRQSSSNAEWLFGWADVGTTVVVLR
ncbi:MAG: L,D-transpeptidase [Actinomycetia bacterium]|nr:L,D-transpeptidase [Actinomycetes bacterium]